MQRREQTGEGGGEEEKENREEKKTKRKKLSGDTLPTRARARLLRTSSFLSRLASTSLS